MANLSGKISRILLVEDRPAWQKVLRHHVEKACREFGINSEIHEAASFSKAWDAIKERSAWELMVTDIELSESEQNPEVRENGKHGILLLELALENNIPAIVVSGSQVVSVDDIRNFFKEYNVRDYFSKNNFDYASPDVS